MPAEYVGLYDAAAAECGSPWITGALLAAQGKQESDHFAADVIDGRRRSGAGAMGVAQFMPDTWKTAWGNPYNPTDAIKAQGDMMCALSRDSRILKPFKDREGEGDWAPPPFVLAAYNAGPGNVEKYNGVPRWKEPLNYIDNILLWSGQFENLDPTLIDKTRALLRDSGHNVWLREAWRTREQQQQLWDEALPQYGNDPVLTRGYVALPGTSNHERGLAVDINGDQNQVAQLAAKHGLCQTELPREYWHLENC